MIKALVVSMICFLIFLAIHFAWFAFLKPTEKSKSVMRTFYFSGLLYPVIYYFLPSANQFTLSFLSDDAIVFIYGICLFAALFLGYLEFYFTADRSITFRMLMMIKESNQGKLTEKEMVDLYQPDQLITRRFNDMVYGGYMMKEGDAFKLTPKGKFAEKIYRITIETLNLARY